MRVEENFLSASFTIVQELTYVICSLHDDCPEEQNYNRTIYMNIMLITLSTKGNQGTCSKSLKDHLTNVMDILRTNCFLECIDDGWRP